MSDCISHQATRPGFWARIVQTLKTRIKQRQDRTAFQHLLTLDPEILKDIGVTRGDVVWANNLPIQQNAAQELRKATCHRARCL